MVQTHSAGGKVSTPLPPGMQGTASFSSCMRYRQWLFRCWEPGGLMSPEVLFIGMNPSTATAEVNDPTITREIGFTRRFGYNAYAKCNVMDYRATDPKQLLTVEEPRSEYNLPAIMTYAESAEIIILAYGALHKSLQKYADETVSGLRAAGHELYCLGLTKSGQPRHPLYLRSDSKLEKYNG